MKETKEQRENEQREKDWEAFQEGLRDPEMQGRNMKDDKWTHKGAKVEELGNELTAEFTSGRITVCGTRTRSFEDDLEGNRTSDEPVYMFSYTLWTLEENRPLLSLEFDDGHDLLQALIAVAEAIGDDGECGFDPR